MKNAAFKFRAALVQRSGAYASAEDFCATFREDTDSLYSLSLALTASHELAHQCFVAALEDCQTGSAVFVECARSWSRRAVIKNAIRLLDPIHSNMKSEPQPKREAIAGEMASSVRWFFRLDRLERFVFVISVLEGYTVRECAALLGASPREVERARVQALVVAGGSQNIAPASDVNKFQKPELTFDAAIGRKPDVHTSFLR